MKTGATSLELDVNYTFSDDGDADLESVKIGDRALPRELARRLLNWLGPKTDQKLVDEAWANAEDVIDDSACDEAREAS